MQESAQKPRPPVQAASRVPQQHGSIGGTTPATQLSGGRQDYLAQLSAQINGGPSVQATAQLQAEADASPRVQALSSMIDGPIQRAAKAANRTGLPDTLKSGVESLSGISLDNVNVHYNSGKPAQLNAHAYAQGTDIHVGPGQEQHLPHEAWHVVQQAQGRVRPTRQLKGDVPVNDDASLEHEADLMGEKAAGIPSSTRPADPSSGNGAPLQAKAPAGAPAVQRRMGLELEFPIPVDGLGTLSAAQETALTRPFPDEERAALQRGTVLDKDLTMSKGDGYVVRPDHQGGKLKPLMVETPAKSTSYNVTEFIFEPPVEALYEVEGVLDNIFDAVGRIGASTNGLTRRAQLDGDYYVGPINTAGEKPEALGLEANSMQINFGIETQKIPDLFVSYAQSTDLSEKNIRAVVSPEAGDNSARIAKIYRDTLVEAAFLSAAVEEAFRKRDDVRAQQPLLGIRGILAVQALYLLMGGLPEEDRLGGTIKNFTPLLMKSSLSWIADYSLTPEEKRLYAAHKNDLLTMLLGMSGKRKGASPSDLLVIGDKGAKTGVKIEDMLTSKLDGPFVVAGAGILPDSVGGPRRSTDPSLRAADKIPYPAYLTAPQRAPTEEEEGRYGKDLARMLAPSSVTPTEGDLSKERQDGQRRNRRRGGVFETRIADGSFTRGAAKSRAKEMFMRVGILHGLDDEDMLTPKGQTERTKSELK